jgi:succinyl-CoA synthetase beta subunit/citryl-CoA synthetase large subunit
VIKACIELGHDPAEKIAIFRIPGAWEEEGFKILERYGVDYADRSVSLNEAARRAVEKIEGSRTTPPSHVGASLEGERAARGRA